MNRDYSYCIGANFFRSRAPEICKNCKRFIPLAEPVQETMTWTLPQYNPNNDTCPLNDPIDNEPPR